METETRILPINQSKKLTIDDGDIMPFKHADFLREMPEENREKYITNVVRFGGNSGNVFNKLESVGIDTNLLRQEYICPHSGMKFNALVPLFLITDDLEKYIEPNFSNKYLFDKDWQWDEIYDVEDKKNLRYPLSRVPKAMLGSGFSYGANASDGINKIIEVGVELSNGDVLVCATWLWFNN